MNVGQQVEVHVGYTNAWATGFEVADVVPGGCRLRRRSDGALLPIITATADLRPLSGTA